MRGERCSKDKEPVFWVRSTGASDIRSGEGASVVGEGLLERDGTGEGFLRTGKIRRGAEWGKGCASAFVGDDGLDDLRMARTGTSTKGIGLGISCLTAGLAVTVASDSALAREAGGPMTVRVFRLTFGPKPEAYSHPSLEAEQPRQVCDLALDP